MERIYITTEPGEEPVNTLRGALKSGSLRDLLNSMTAAANSSGAASNLDDAALALNALLGEISERRMPLIEARKVASISINFLKAVTIIEILPALEADFGANAISWARGVFRHLGLGTPYIH